MSDIKNNNKSYILTHLHVFRRIVQVCTIVFIVLVPFLNKQGYHGIIGTFYSISFGALDIVDPALLLQSILLTKSFYLPLIIAAIIPIILAALFGKVFCSWGCPFNFISELSELLRKKARKIYFLKNVNPKKRNYWIVYVSIFLVIMITGVPLITFISMPGLITSQIADGIMFKTIGIEIFLVLIILIIEVVFAPRFWCKYACPVGATLALFHNKRSLRISYNSKNCAICELAKDRVCNISCPLNLNPRGNDIYPYCYNCMECVDICQKNGKALNISYNKK